MVQMEKTTVTPRRTHVHTLFTIPGPHRRSPRVPYTQGSTPALARPLQSTTERTTVCHESVCRQAETGRMESRPRRERQYRRGRFVQDQGTAEVDQSYDWEHCRFVPDESGLCPARGVCGSSGRGASGPDGRVVLAAAGGDSDAAAHVCGTGGG
mmetsp:Transcript_8044/g.11664  ORF Transcript_8044/g.11664 Transcript_8044/m.11664 type:complete len:154 (+) Transcript_8044:498-959(+)